MRAVAGLLRPPRAPQRLAVPLRQRGLELAQKRLEVLAKPFLLLAVRASLGRVEVGDVLVGVGHLVHLDVRLVARFLHGRVVVDFLGLLSCG